MAMENFNKLPFKNDEITAGLNWSDKLSKFSKIIPQTFYTNIPIQKKAVGKWWAKFVENATKMHLSGGLT